MKLGTSSPLRHNSPEEWAKKQIELGCTTVVFPAQSNEPEDVILGYKNAADDAGLTIAEVGIWRNIMSSTGFSKVSDIDDSAIY